MKIEKVVVGELEENCYILKSKGKALIIDPGNQFLSIKEQVGNYKVLKVLLTHRHFDHIGALSDCLKYFSVDALDFQSFLEKEYTVGPFTFQVLFTPGHTSDSISFYFPKQKAMFVGDFVFQGSIGRCDLPTGNLQQMKSSIQKLIYYEDNIVLYPGHGSKTILGIEKKQSIFYIVVCFFLFIYRNFLIIMLYFL